MEDKYLECMGNYSLFTKGNNYLIREDLGDNMYAIQNDKGDRVCVSIGAGGFVHSTKSEVSLSELCDDDKAIKCICPKCGNETITIDIPIDLVNELINNILRSHINNKLGEEMCE